MIQLSEIWIYKLHIASSSISVGKIDAQCKSPAEQFLTELPMDYETSLLLKDFPNTKHRFWSLSYTPKGEYKNVNILTSVQIRLFSEMPLQIVYTSTFFQF